MSEPIRIANRYEVIRPLGRGSFAQTLLVMDTTLKRRVALKVLRPKAEHEWKAFELFEREAAVLKELRHPGIPMVHEAFRAEYEGEENAILSMEYIEGTSAAELIADRRHLEQEDVLNLFIELLGVLDYLHTRVPPVLHRDIKPANIIVRPGGLAALVDFGAVRNVFRAADEGGSTIVGTYGYMPYEQYMGQASPASDLYALAASFLHLMTGRAPPEFMSPAGRLEVPAGLPCNDAMQRVLARLLQPAANDRFQSAREARRALVGGAAPLPVPVDAVAVSTLSVPVALAHPPRALGADTRELMGRVTYSTWDLMDSDGEPATGASLIDLLMVAFFSVVTAGIMPALFYSRKLARKRRVMPFVTDGLPATAKVVEVAVEKIEFEARLARVRYAFEADGRRRVGSDRVLPRMTRNWDPGMEILVLYLPDRDYDSVIVGPVPG